jgi:hypothetical protein
MIGDSTGPNSLKSNDMIRKLGVSGRHLGNDKVEGNGINVIILTQSLKAVPKVVRQQIDILFAGKCASRVEREALVYEFLCLRSDRDGIKEAYRVYDVRRHHLQLTVPIHHHIELHTGENGPQRLRGLLQRYLPCEATPAVRRQR